MMFQVRIDHDIPHILSGNLNKFDWRASVHFDGLNTVSQFVMNRKSAASLAAVSKKNDILTIVTKT